jgi:hypothetical protein
MIAVTFGSLCRISAVTSLTADAISALIDGEFFELEYVTVMSGIFILLWCGKTPTIA